VPAFAWDGFVRIDSFLSPAEVTVARRLVDKLAREPVDPSCVRPHNTLVPLRFNHPLVDLALRGRERVDRLAASVGASDLRWISGYVSIKEPKSGALWWHQDWWCWQHPASFASSAPQVAVLCYLRKTDRQSGALRVWPGSHRASTPLHAVLPGAHRVGMEGIGWNHPAMADHREQVTLAACAGDAVVIDYRLLHGTHPNASSTRRNCLLLNFTPGWRDLRADLRAHLIRHPAQPGSDERAEAAWAARLLPTFHGVPRDLPLDREAPARFGQRKPASLGR
jgi:ectoine hydroxylase-related dioxygenase (phytanoyl-CoA dioxygenase family)